MSLLEGLRAHLAESQAVVSLVGKKVFGEKSDQWAKRPTLIYSQTGGDEPGHLGGTSCKSRAQVQVDAWADDKSEAERIADAVRDVIHTQTNTRFGAVKVRSCFLQSGPVSGWVAMEDGGDVGAHRSSSVYQIWYSVPEPVGV